MKALVHTVGMQSKVLHVGKLWMVKTHKFVISILRRNFRGLLETIPKGGTDGGAGGILAPPLLLFEGIAPPLFLDPSSERVLTLGGVAPCKQ